MQTRIVEVTNGPNNWGKFLLGRFDATERARRSVVDENRPLLRAIGWDAESVMLVLDLQTGEGAVFRLGGLAKADLNKHRVWVCPMYEPFLEWLYARWRSAENDGDRWWWEGMPTHVDLPDAPFAMHGYRREG